MFHLKKILLLNRNDMRSKVMPIVASRNVRSNSKSGGVNEGIQKRLSILKKETPEYQKLNIDEQAIEDMESDFMNSREIVDFHKREVKKLKSIVDYKIIERKFSEKKALPNLLTWSEKEQIRQLHQSDPETWTPLKLSQSFPATPDIIKKLLKNQWKIDPSKIKNHDNAVLQNWELIKSGKLSIDKSLQEHILSFSEREKSILQHMKTSTDCNSRKEIKNRIDPSAVTEFSQIISSNKKNIEPDTSSEEETTLAIKEPLRKRFSKNGQCDYTLEELRKEVHSSRKPFSPEAAASNEAFLKQSTSNTPLTLYNENIEILPKDLSLESKYTVQEVEVNPLVQGVGYSVKIKIPEEKRRKGALYKVKDCYYDDDGAFLYRVPGMASE